MRVVARLAILAVRGCFIVAAILCLGVVVAARSCMRGATFADLARGQLLEVGDARLESLNAVLLAGSTVGWLDRVNT